MATTFRWSGEHPQYTSTTPNMHILEFGAGGLELCTLELNHYGLVENGVYKGGKVCYVDNCVDDYLSLVDLQKIGVELGYNVDITQKVTSLKVYHKKPGKFGASALIEVKDDSFIPGLIACIPGNRIVQLYYHDPTDLNTIGSQAFEVWPSLDSENYNGGTDEFKGHQYWPFIDCLANADNSVKKVNTYEAASVGIHGNIQEFNEDEAREDNENNEKEGENEEEDEVFVDSDYGVSDDEEPINVEEVNGVDAPNEVFDVNHPNEVLDFHPPNEATGEISSDGEDIDIPYSGSDEEEGEQNFNKLSKKRKRKLPSFKQWRRDTDLRNPEFRLGMQFANKAEVKEAIKEWAIINGREVKFVKDDKIRVRAKCVGNKKTKCPFTIFASIIDSDEPTFAIKTFCLDHHCGRVGKLKFANSNWLAEKFADKIKKNPHWNVGAFKSNVAIKNNMPGYGAEFVVDLKAKTCSCRRWDLCGIPCPHVISCIFSTDENVYDYTHDCYKQEAYLISYDPIVHPVPSMDQWKKTGLPAISPPPYKKQPGRPKMSRTKEVGEVQVPAPPPPNPIPPDYIPPPAKLKRIFVNVKCGICGQRGHNRLSHKKEGEKSSSNIQEGAQGYSDHFHQINGPNPSIGIGKPKGCDNS
ncbi:unnamed protein product [Malus baccata var. baccata]